MDYFSADPQTVDSNELEADSARRPGLPDRGRTSFMTADITNIIDEMSSSEGSEAEFSDADDESEELVASPKPIPKPVDRHESLHQPQKPKPSQFPLPSQKPAEKSEKAGKGKGLLKPSVEPSSPAPAGVSRLSKHPRLARFVSLRSTLFSAHIADAEAQSKEEDQDESKKPSKSKSNSSLASVPEASREPEPADKAEASSLSRTAQAEPKTAPIETFPQVPEPEQPPRERKPRSFSTQLDSRLQELSMSHDPPTVVSTPSSSREDIVEREPSDRNLANAELEGTPPDSDSLEHSDVEEIVHYVTRTEEPGILKRSKTEGVINTMSSSSSSALSSDAEIPRRDSLGHSDVDDLVQWVSRRESPNATSQTTEAKKEGEKGKKKSMRERVHKLKRQFTT